MSANWIQCVSERKKEIRDKRIRLPFPGSVVCEAQTRARQWKNRVYIPFSVAVFHEALYNRLPVGKTGKPACISSGTLWSLVKKRGKWKKNKIISFRFLVLHEALYMSLTRGKTRRASIHFFWNFTKLTKKTRKRRKLEKENLHTVSFSSDTWSLVYEKREGSQHTFFFLTFMKLTEKTRNKRQLTNSVWVQRGLVFVCREEGMTAMHLISSLFRRVGWVIWVREFVCVSEWPTFRLCPTFEWEENFCVYLAVFLMCVFLSPRVCWGAAEWLWIASEWLWLGCLLWISVTASSWVTVPGRPAVSDCGGLFCLRLGFGVYYLLPMDNAKWCDLTPYS